TETVRVFVQPNPDPMPIPDGPLYTCTFMIKPATLPRTFRLMNDNTIAFGADGMQLAHVAGANGSVTVSLVIPPSASPTISATPTATGTPTVSATPTENIDRCPHDLVLTPGTATVGGTVHLSGRCDLLQSGRRAQIYLDAAVVGTLTGDSGGN